MAYRLIFVVLIAPCVVGVALASRLQSADGSTERMSAELRQRPINQLSHVGGSRPHNEAAPLFARAFGDEVGILADRKASLSRSDFVEARGVRRNQLSTPAAIGIGLSIAVSALALLVLCALTDKDGARRLQES